MVDVVGVAQGVRTEQEGSSIVLRFVLQCDDGDRIPVEMRGAKVLGVLDDGDRVQLAVRGKRIRGREGVARPDRISNSTTQSLVRVTRSTVSRVTGFIFSLAVSLASGLVPVGVGLILQESIESEGDENGLVPYRFPPPAVDESGEVPVVLISLVVGAVVALAVFFLIYVRSRRG